MEGKKTIPISDTEYSPSEAGYNGGFVSGILAGADQIYRTFVFELTRGLKKILILTSVYIAIFVLNLITVSVRYGAGVPLPDKPMDYAESLFPFFTMLLMISATFFGSPMIGVDFDKRTGNLLFPKIPRGRLLLGRLLYALIFGAADIIIFYLCVTGAVAFNYKGNIPQDLFISMGFAVFYYIMLLSFFIFSSAIMPTVPMAHIFGIIMVLIGFDIVVGILSVTTKIEPLFIPTYYSNIIFYCYKMPDTRYTDINLKDYGANVDMVIRQWITPSVRDAFLGITIFTIIFLVTAYFIYRERNIKNI